MVILCSILVLFVRRETLRHDRTMRTQRAFLREDGAACNAQTAPVFFLPLEQRGALLDAAWG